MKKPIKITIIVVVACAISALSFWGGYFTYRLSVREEMYDINYIIDMYRKYYYDEEDNVVGIFSSSLLDKYSAFYTKEEHDAIKRADTGEREGIGVTFSGALITKVYGNSPAEKAGVKTGGRTIGFVYGDKTVVVTDDNLIAEMKAVPAYTDFTMIVDYGGETEVFTLQKQDYLETFVRYSDSTGEYGFSDSSGEMEFVRLGDGTLTGKTAYIKYDGFSGSGRGLYGSVGQFERAMQAYRDGGMRNIIIDIRRNGGGFIYILQNVCRYFLGTEEGSRPPVCVVKDKYGNEEYYKSEPVTYSQYNYDNIVVLADIYTASAAEAFIGALLDYDAEDKVKVIIDAYEYGGYKYYRTYGKGIMQTTFERVDGAAIKLTTAKIFWPTSDVCIHDVGVSTALNDRFGGKIVNASAAGAYSDALSLCA